MGEALIGERSGKVVAITVRQLRVGSEERQKTEGRMS
jgi:hypothetical protein